MTLNNPKTFKAKARHAAAAIALVLASPAAASDEPKNEIHGDWAVRCVEREALPPCDMVQFATHRENGEAVMQFSIAHAGREDAYGMQIMVPLGVRLSGGVAIRVDEGSPMTGFEFTRCEAAGCYIERVVSDEVLEPFRAGDAGVLGVIDRTGEPLVIPLSFRGFTKALATITERNRQWADNI